MGMGMSELSLFFFSLLSCSLPSSFRLAPPPPSLPFLSAGLSGRRWRGEGLGTTSSCVGPLEFASFMASFGDFASGCRRRCRISAESGDAVFIFFVDVLLLVWLAFPSLNNRLSSVFAAAAPSSIPSTSCLDLRTDSLPATRGLSLVPNKIHCLSSCSWSSGLELQYQVPRRTFCLFALWITKPDVVRPYSFLWLVIFDSQDNPHILFGSVLSSDLPDLVRKNPIYRRFLSGFSFLSSRWFLRISYWFLSLVAAALFNLHTGGPLSGFWARWPWLVSGGVAGANPIIHGGACPSQGCSLVE